MGYVRRLLHSRRMKGGKGGPKPTGDDMGPKPTPTGDDMGPKPTPTGDDMGPPMPTPDKRMGPKGTRPPPPPTAPGRRALDKLILLYTFHESPKDYATAQSICQAGGGSLAMPRSPQQWEELLAARPSEDVQLTDSLWMGLDAKDGGTWRWNSGDDVTWADWMDGQPDGSGECGVWYTRDPPASWAQADRWDDWRCAESLSFVCQSDCYDIYGPSHCPWQCPNPNCRRSCGMCGGDTFWTKMWSEINPPWYANYNMNDRNIKRLLDVMTKHKKTE